MPQWLTILVAAMGFGAAGVLTERYRAFKMRRLQRSYEDRNLGFWTDARVVQAEYFGTALVLGVPFCVIVSAVATNNNIYANLATLLAYAVGIWLIMLALKPRPQ